MDSPREDTVQLMETGVKWTAIVLTCSKKMWAEPLQNELETRQAKGQIGQDVILLTVEDPKANVGSGGATLNALLQVSEYISAQQGFTVINPDILVQSRILILHCGRMYSYDPCTRPFVTLPMKSSASMYDSLVCSIDLLMHTITTQLATKAGPGVWISSTDTIMSIPAGADIPWKTCDACVIAVPSTTDYCTRHGVYQLDSEGNVQDILFKKSKEVLQQAARPDGSMAAVVGVTYFSSVVAEKLLATYTKPPLDACTYLGVDSGQPPLNLSLFFDVLLPMTSGVSKEDFVSGSRSSTYGQPGTGDMGDRLSSSCAQARRMLWKDLHGYKLHCCLVEQGCFYYVLDQASDHCAMMRESKLQARNCGLTFSPRTHTWLEGCKPEEGTVVINSVLRGHVTVPAHTIVTHSSLEGHVTLGKNCLVSGLQIQDETHLQEVRFGDSVVVQVFHVYLASLDKTQQVSTVVGVHDDLRSPVGRPGGTFCNQPWQSLMARTGIREDDLWDSGMDASQRCLINAKLFPIFHVFEGVGLPELLWLQGAPDHQPDPNVLKRWRASWRMSLEEILVNVDLAAELHWRRTLFYRVSQLEIEHVLKQELHKGFRSVYYSASVEGFAQSILDTLDRVAVQETSPGVVARTLANVADVLGCMAGRQGGLRSGPAANRSWRAAFNFLEKGEVAAGVQALARERQEWLSRPSLLIRAARHYEGASAILIRQAVMTAKQFVSFGEGQLPAMGRWVQADCPARIDISGGWSDTPPITYEHGGAVVNAAILINGKRPIGAKARRIERPAIEMVICGEEGGSTTVVCTELSHMEDYYQPHSPGALLKAAFVCCDIVDLHSSDSLARQLQDKYGGGFEVHSWSNLPHGSGLGTSSILSGAVLAAVLTVAGKTYKTEDLIHAVLYLEQLLTTGGGWQDQVGGLTGGVKLSESPACLPLKVTVTDLKVGDDVIQALNERLVLIYTGKTRLARNLLQDVLRNWYARNPHILATEDALVALAQDCAAAFHRGDLDRVGACADAYWEYKKRMAPGCETTTIARLMTSLRPQASGVCMAGAGGGGFLWAIMRDAQAKRAVPELLQSDPNLEGTVLYDAEVDPTGLTVTLQ